MEIDLTRCTCDFEIVYESLNGRRVILASNSRRPMASPSVLRVPEGFNNRSSSGGAQDTQRHVCSPECFNIRSSSDDSYVDSQGHVCSPECFNIGSPSDDSYEEAQRHVRSPLHFNRESSSDENIQRNLRKRLPKANRSLDTSAKWESSSVVTCPVCLHFAGEITSWGNELLAPECGHIICSECMIGILRSTAECPKCREKISQRRIRRIYL